MPQPVRLRIACHGHPSDHTLWGDGQQLESHLAVESATHIGIFGRDVLPVMDRSHRLRR